jgi:hypothetical protein
LVDPRGWIYTEDGEKYKGIHTNCPPKKSFFFFQQALTVMSFFPFFRETLLILLPPLPPLPQRCAETTHATLAIPKKKLFTTTVIQRQPHNSKINTNKQTATT